MSWFFWLFIITYGAMLLSLGCMLWADLTHRFSIRDASAKIFFLSSVMFFSSAVIGKSIRDSQLRQRITLDKVHQLTVKNVQNAPVEVTYLADTLGFDGIQKTVLLPGETKRLGCDHNCACNARYKLLSVEPVSVKQPQDKMTVAMRYKQLTEGK